MRTLRPMAICAFLLAAPAAVAAAEQGVTPAGIWQDPSQRIQVKIAPCGEQLCGTLVWFRWPDDDAGLPVADLKNPDAALRARPLLGLTILRDLRRAGENEWEGGSVYNPDDGVDYHALMSVEGDGRLRLRIYELLPAFGETQLWTRID